MTHTWIEETMASMTLEEKVGQVLMVGFWNLNAESFPEIRKKIRQYPIGGFFHFNAGQSFLADCFRILQEDAKVPLLVAADYELGLGWVVEEGVRFPRAMARGYHADESQEYEIAKSIARQGRSIGANITFSPVVDVNTEPLCPDVNVRAYSDDPEVIAKLAIHYIKGLQENGMLATVKHFPGNGGTIMDQHISAAVISHSKDKMKEIWLAPYRQCIQKADVSAVMVAHLEVPSLCNELHPETGRPVPASMSREIITDLLRGELQFRGLVITDAMNMGGVNSQYTRNQANIKTLQAGTDLILDFHPLDFEKDFEGLIDAVDSGVLDRKRLDNAVQNVLIAKVKAGLHADSGLPANEKERKRLFQSGQYNSMCRTISGKAVTILKNRGSVLPIRNIQNKKVCVLNVFGPENRILVNQGQFAMKEGVVEALKKRGAVVDEYEVTSEWPFGQVGDVARKTAEYDYTFLNFFVVPNFAIGTLIPNINAVRLFFNGILTEAGNIIITAFGDPYIIQYCQAAPVYVCTFDDSLHSQEAAVRAWLGESPVRGRMPVTFPGFFKRGDGLNIS